MFARTVVLGVVGIVLGSLSAEAQIIGTFSWQTQPYCNRVTMTVVQQGGVYQLVGTDDQCGAGPAPVTGTAIPSGSGVAMGVTVSLGTGHAAHLSATIALANLSGTWADADGRTGPFAFSGTTGGAPRPAPAAASAILVTQFSPTVYAGTGAAATVARSDHTHDDRYYTRTQVDSRRAGEVIAMGYMSATGAQPTIAEQRTAAGITLSATSPALGRVDLVVTGADTTDFPLVMVTAHSSAALSRTCNTRSLAVGPGITTYTARIECYDATGAAAATSFQFVVID